VAREGKRKGRKLTAAMESKKERQERKLEGKVRNEGGKGSERKREGEKETDCIHTVRACVKVFSLNILHLKILKLNFSKLKVPTVAAQSTYSCSSKFLYQTRRVWASRPANKDGGSVRRMEERRIVMLMLCIYVCPCVSYNVV
jgi:hypothetical protein